LTCKCLCVVRGKRVSRSGEINTSKTLVEIGTTSINAIKINFTRFEYMTGTISIPAASFHLINVFLYLTLPNMQQDRHYLHHVFPELDPSSHTEGPDHSPLAAGSPGPGLTLLEVGCGVGNAVFPLLELNPALYVYAIDHAKSAVTILK
jgi:2-polyprenyl-3-methyl-5-hydroxy-6-metoxy-1,4-benzoquinol methylase